MKTVSFETSKAESRIIQAIAKRASKLAAAHEIDYSIMDADMDITACHANGMRLELEELLNADSFNFSHDVFGIRCHLNRSTGQLEDCFVPRFSAK